MEYKLRKYMKNNWWEVIDGNVIKDFISGTFKLECPIYLRNAECAIRFNFDDLDAKKTAQVATEITSKLFSDNDFYFLHYYSIGIPPKILKRYIKGNPNKESCIEYKTLHSSDDFVPRYNNISYVKVNNGTFNIKNYAKDIAFDRGGESDIYLADIDGQYALHFYDCRGLDIVAKNKVLLLDLYNSFRQYVSPYNIADIERNLLNDN